MHIPFLLSSPVTHASFESSWRIFERRKWEGNLLEADEG
jgi:hypothetical protein